MRPLRKGWIGSGALAAIGAGALLLARAEAPGEEAYLQGADLDLLESVRQIARKVESLAGGNLGNVVVVRARGGVLPPAADSWARFARLPASRWAARGRAWEDIGLGGEQAIRTVLGTIEDDLPGLRVVSDPPRLVLGPSLLSSSNVGPGSSEEAATSALLHAIGVSPDEVLVAHGLVHLLQAGRERSGSSRPHTTDRILARAAWEEGEATFVSLLYLFRGLGLTEDLLRGRLDPSEVLGGRLLPQWKRVAAGPAQALLEFVYGEGFYRVAELVRREGIGSLAKAPELRPATADLLHLERAPVRAAPLELEPPQPAGLELSDQDEVGEQGIVVLVSTVTGKDDIALLAGDGWAGDALWRWEGRERGNEAASSGVTVWLTRWSTRKDAEEFAYAWRRSLEERFPGVRIETGPPGSGRVEASGKLFTWVLEDDRVLVRISPQPPTTKPAKERSQGS